MFYKKCTKTRTGLRLYTLTIGPLVRSGPRFIAYPLIHQLKQNIKQVWYADDATTTGRVCDLKQWWDQLENIGPKYGYVVNPTKTWLIVKETFLSEANEISRTQISASLRKVTDILVLHWAPKLMSTAM